jgi:GT2 family glycosyltransferase
MSAALSVAIVAYRTDAALLGRALESLASAADHARREGLLDRVEVFVIDNGPPASYPDTLRAVERWPAAERPVHVLQGHGNLGYGSGNNLVLERLSSDVHLVMNPDVELEPGSLAAGLRALAEHPDVGLAAPDVVDAAGERQWLCKRYPSALVLFVRGFVPRAWRAPFARRLAAYEMRDVIGERFLRGVPLASGAFMLVRTTLFRALHGFDPAYFMYFEDYDLSLRVGRQATIAYVPGMRIVHRGGDASRKGLRHVAWFTSSARRFFSRHGWKLI